MMFPREQAELARFDGAPDDVEIFFSAHGVPESYVEQAGDPYKEEMEQCIGFIISELRVRHSLGCPFEASVTALELLADRQTVVSTFIVCSRKKIPVPPV